VPPARQPRSEPGEIENCTPYLISQIELVAPRVICTLGNFATKLLRDDPAGITRVHGQVEVRRSAATRPGCSRSTTRRRRSTRRARWTLREDFVTLCRRARAAAPAARRRARRPAVRRATAEAIEREPAGPPCSRPPIGRAEQLGLF
jgi:hypothetical protein